MQLLIESTDQFVAVDGVACRLWKGFTEDGVRVDVYVHRLRVQADADLRRFDAELLEQPAPKTVASASPADGTLL